MIDFFRDILDGPLYIVITILSIIFIMAIIGFLMERKKLEKEAKQKIAVVTDTKPVVPVTPVTVTQSVEVPNGPMVNGTSNELNSYPEVKTPVVVFEPSNQEQK